jgi:Putative zinc dependent peptidase (DUF5700)
MQEKPLDFIDASANKKQIITFDDSGLEASLNYLRNGSDENFQKLLSASGNKLAYAHHSWSSFSSKATIEQFWSTQLSKLTWSPELEHNLNAVKTYLLKQEKTKWLSEVLSYLPEGHLFSTVVYLNMGYDDIVLGENIALNLNSQKFGLDKRESIYYLIHELAHAGYVRYHPLPALSNIRTNRELLTIVKYLTHLEGMGVISSLKLRLAEGGLLDNDYKVLLNETERTKRVNRYFKIFSNLERNLDKKIGEDDLKVFEEMSGKETRLWYVTGCHMAQEIEKHRGAGTLRKLVEQGSEAFFDAY